MCVFRSILPFFAASAFSSAATATRSSSFFKLSSFTLNPTTAFMIMFKDQPDRGWFLIGWFSHALATSLPLQASSIHNSDHVHVISLKQTPSVQYAVTLARTSESASTRTCPSSSVQYVGALLFVVPKPWCCHLYHVLLIAFLSFAVRDLLLCVNHCEGD